MEQTSSNLGARMSVGLAILLSSLLFAVVLLYGMTKHRWSWRRIVERTRQTFIVLIVLTAAVIGFWYFWNQLPTPPSPQTEYAGLRLGIGPDEVISQKVIRPWYWEKW